MTSRFSINLSESDDNLFCSASSSSSSSSENKKGRIPADESVIILDISDDKEPDYESLDVNQKKQPDNSVTTGLNPGLDLDLDLSLEVEMEGGDDPSLVCLKSMSYKQPEKSKQSSFEHVEILDLSDDNEEGKNNNAPKNGSKVFKDLPVLNDDNIPSLSFQFEFSPKKTSVKDRSAKQAGFGLQLSQADTIDLTSSPLQERNEILPPSSPLISRTESPKRKPESNKRISSVEHELLSFAKKQKSDSELFASSDDNIFNSPAHRSSTLPSKPTDSDAFMAKYLANSTSSSTSSSTSRPALRSSSKQPKASASGIASRVEKHNKQQQKLQQKEQLREQKIKQSELEEVNMARKWKRDVAVQDLIVNVHPEMLEDSEAFSGESLNKVLAELHVSVKPQHDISRYKFNGAYILMIQHRLRSKFDSKKGWFVPTPERIEEESFLIVFATAAEFGRLLKDVEHRDLNKHIESIRSLYANKKIIYIVQGVSEFVRKVENRKNREIAAQVRQIVQNSTNLPPTSGNTAAASTQNKRKRKASTTGKISGTLLDELGYANSRCFDTSFIHLQVTHSVRILQTSNSQDTCTWIGELLKDISTCFFTEFKPSTLDVRVKCGNNAQEVFKYALQQIKFVTPAVSQVLSHSYSNVCNMDAQIRARHKDGVQELADLKKERGQRIGNAMANSIKTLLTSKDPDEFL